MKAKAAEEESAKLKASRKEARELRASLKMLTANVTGFLALLDVEMKAPSTHQRGSRIAKLSNALEFANDRAKRFGLGIPFDDPAWKDGVPS